MATCVRCGEGVEAIFARRLKDGTVCSTCDTRRCGRCGKLFGEHFVDGRCLDGRGKWKPTRRAPGPERSKP